MKTMIIAAILFVALPHAALAQASKGGTSAGDPIFFAEYTNQPGYNNPQGRAPLPAVVSGTHIKGISMGQSICANGVQDTYTPTNLDKVRSLSIYDGSISRAVPPLLGTSLAYYDLSKMGNLLIRLGDKLVNAGASAFTIMDINAGGSFIADWSQPNGVLFPRIVAAMKRMNQIGYTPNFVLVCIGESDGISGTTQATFAAGLQNVIAQWRAAGFSGPIVVNQESWIGSTTYSAITNAQASVVNTSLGIYAGGNLDTISNTGRFDTTHLNATGADSAATLIFNALHAIGAPFP